MEIYQSREEIQERFADAAAALVMDRYLSEMQENATQENFSEIPAALDQKCRKLIKKRLMKKRCKDISINVLHYVKTVAIAIVMLFGIGGILFTTVEAVRVPIINFFIAHTDSYLVISGASTDGNQDTDIFSKYIRWDFFPESYDFKYCENTSSGGFLLVYENDANDYIILTVEPSEGTIHVDVENAVSETLSVVGCNAILINKDGYQLVWLNEKTGERLQLDATALSRGEIITLAEKIEKMR